MAPLSVHYRSCSEKGLSSVTSLIVGTLVAAVIDPPFLIPDAIETIEWIKKTTKKPIKAIFATHHHPDHYFSANPILEAFPGSTLYAAPYVCAGIDREYDEKVKYWPKIVGAENVPEKPTKPTSFNFSFFQLYGDLGSPIMLIGPVQGDSIDHTLFWLPTERVIICGDAVFARSTHVWVEEVETPALLRAWQRTLDTIEALNPKAVIPGHVEDDWTLDAAADLAHTRRYLDLFASKVTFASKTPQVDDLYNFFKGSFPQADKNVDFFLGNLSNHYGEGGKAWEENRLHNVADRTELGLTGYLFK